MTDDEIIKAMQCVIGNDASCSECRYQKVLPFPSCRKMCAKNALDLINRQKVEIERLNKDCEDVIYKLEYLLCNATGNKFSKHTYPIGDMVSYVNDYIQDCCNEAVEEAKEAVKSEAIKEFAERLKEKLNNLEYHENTDRKTVTKAKLYHVVNWVMREVVPEEIDNLVKEMIV